MKRFNLELFDGHPIIRHNDQAILIDTGSPQSIHAQNTLSFCNDDYHCTTNLMGVTVARLSEMLKTEISSLLGTDIIANYRMMLDYKARVVEFSKHEIPFSGREHGISSFMGIPVVELSVDEQTVKCFLDTGARLSYLSSSFTNGQPVVSTEEDFYPSLGTFTTECHDMLTHFDGHGFVVRYGTPPQMIQMLLQMAGADGIIGFDFFTNHKVMLDLKKQLLMVEKQAD